MPEDLVQNDQADFPLPQKKKTGWPKGKPRGPRRPRERMETLQPRAIEFEGLTANDCANACRPDRCVISHDNICVHPFKGGLHSIHQSKHDVVQRYKRAKAMLAHQKVDLTGGR